MRLQQSDIDVPSVAQHPQNEYRSGFQTIVRVMVEVLDEACDKVASHRPRCGGTLAQ